MNGLHCAERYRNTNRLPQGALLSQQRWRFLETLSAYARQFVGRMEKPDVEHIEGLAPAIAVDQRSVPRGSRSTVGTLTEIFDHLRVLYARAGTAHCPEHGTALTCRTPESIVERRDWCVGTPDDAIAWIEKKLADNGPFGGVMLSMHEWTRSEKLRRSLELFARYVMPRFRKPTTHFRDEWVRLQAAVSEHGAVQIETDERGSNLRSV